MTGPYAFVISWPGGMHRPMKTPSNRPLHPLDQSWPAFLDRLDTDPRTAFRDFYSFAWRLLKSHPPAAMRSLLPADREEMISEVILHCWQNDCRVLRTYRDRHIPFSHWFLMVARRKTLDHIRARERRGATDPDRPHAPMPGEPGPLIDPAPLADEHAIARQNLESAQRCIMRMGRNCQLLLQGSALGLRPREMTQLLGWPRDWGKKVSDSLRYCRGKLRELLQREGVDWRDMSGRKKEKVGR